jgi:hypothetical protein
MEVHMADASNTLVWPNGAWKTLKRIVRAWYTVEQTGGELTQKAIAAIADIQQSRLSTNKPFLQTICIIEAGGIALTEEGKRLGLGLANENDLVVKQALQAIVKTNPILRQLLGVIRGRGPTDRAEFEAQVTMITKQGRQSDYFATGVGVLEEILLESGLVAMVDNNLRPASTELKEEPKDSLRETSHSVDAVVSTGLKRIPIAVSTESVWYVEVGEKPKPEEVQKFLDMQKLMFS